MTTQKLSLGQLVKKINNENGTTICTPTAYRWTVRGVRGIVLKSISIGGRTYVEWADWLNFNRAVSEERVPSKAKEQATKRKSKRVADADHVLKKAGII